MVLRPATVSDAERLFDWRNDEHTRSMSHNPEPVEWDAHVDWLDRVLADPDRRLFIAEEVGVPVGTDLDGGVYELSWTVAPEARGQGVGKRMVAALVANLDAPVRAEVKASNVASQRIAEAVGMRFDRRDGDVLHYEAVRPGTNRQ